MSVDPAEHAAFKAKLAQTPVEVIVKRLDENAFLRPWKQELAKAEVARRIGELKPNTVESGPDRARKAKKAALMSWVFAIVLILLAVAIGYLKMSDYF